jgi:hypothetical protein
MIEAVCMNCVCFLLILNVVNVLLVQPFHECSNSCLSMCDPCLMFWLATNANVAECKVVVWF